MWPAFFDVSQGWKGWHGQTPRAQLTHVDHPLISQCSLVLVISFLYHWLVVSNIWIIFHFIYGMSSFPVTNSYVSRWWNCTTNQWSISSKSPFLMGKLTIHGHFPVRKLLIIWYCVSQTPVLSDLVAFALATATGWVTHEANTPPRRKRFWCFAPFVTWTWRSFWPLTCRCFSERSVELFSAQGSRNLGRERWGCS